MAWRVAKSLLVLREQVNAAYPGRNKANDGTIGDESHQTRDSDHNPWVKDGTTGIVTAMDITHDPQSGCDSYKLAEIFRLSRDKRIKYIISNRKIAASYPTHGEAAWAWRAYSGSNPHDHHVHVSVKEDKALYDDEAKWIIDGHTTPISQAAPSVSHTVFTDITATEFGGADDPNASSYGGRVDPNVPGVALPFRFPNNRPRVRVSANGRSVDCDVVDVGPWNTNDPYWTHSGTRPQAESGTDLRGRKTNGAGIDLTPAAAKAIGIADKGKVSWLFIENDPVPVKPVTAKDVLVGTATTVGTGGIMYGAQQPWGVTEWALLIVGVLIFAALAYTLYRRIKKGTWSWTSTGAVSQGPSPHSLQNLEQYWDQLSAHLGASSADSQVTSSRARSVSRQRRKRLAQRSRKTPKRKKNLKHSKRNTVKRSSRRRKSR